MDTVIRVQILDEAIFFSDWANTIKKSMNPTSLHPAMGKEQRKLFSLGMATS